VIKAEPEAPRACSEAAIRSVAWARGLAAAGDLPLAVNHDAQAPSQHGLRPGRGVHRPGKASMPRITFFEIQIKATPLVRWFCDQQFRQSVVRVAGAQPQRGSGPPSGPAARTLSLARPEEWQWTICT
jgi:hypothetical protein